VRASRAAARGETLEEHDHDHEDHDHDHEDAVVADAAHETEAAGVVDETEAHDEIEAHDETEASAEAADAGGDEAVASDTERGNEASE
jgi:hypothetical protein